MKKSILMTIVVFVMATAIQNTLLPTEEEVNLSLAECLVNLLKSNEDNYFKIAIFDSSEFLKTTSDLLKLLHTPVIINFREQHQWTGLDTRTPTNIIVALNKTIEPIDIINNTLWYSETKFFMIADENENLTITFLKFWSFQVRNVFILVQEISEIALYTFKPFKPGNCSQIEVILLDRWSGGNFLEKGLSSFYIDIINFNECPVNLSMTNNRPNTNFHPDCECLKIVDTPQEKTSQCERFDKLRSNLTAKCVDGIEGKIITEIGKKLNYSATYVIPNYANVWGFIKPEPVGIVGTVYLGQSIIGFTSLAPTLERYDSLDLSAPFSGDECVTFLVPKGAGQKIPTWIDLLLAEFSYEHWIGISVSYIIFSILLRELNKRKQWSAYAFIYTFALTLQIATKQPTKLPLRILFITWCWSTFILVIAYQTSMSSSLTVPESDPDINTLPELLASNLKIIGFAQVLRWIQFIGEGDFKTMADRFIIRSEEIVTLVDEIVSERNLAAARDKTTILYYSRILPRAKGKLHVMKDCVHTFPPRFVLKKRSPLTKRVNQIIENLKEMGITQYWRSLYIQKVPPAPEEIVKLSMNHVKGIFLVLLIGYGLAIVCFAIELLKRNFVSRVTKIVRERTFHLS